MLVFILLMGEFLIPAMLGGGKVFFIGNALVDLFLQSRNWAFGAAVAVTLVVLMLVTVDGLSYQEAAQALNIPLGTVMSRLSRARIRLADQLGHAGNRHAD